VSATGLSGDSTAPGPLDGLIVADLTRVLAGPYCTMLMADLGATVIKVESPLGDETRGWLPPEHDGVSTYYASVNRNKRSVVLDFGVDSDVALVERLLERADIAVENFKPGGLARFGLDFNAARELNSQLIYLSISGFGTAGGAQLAGYDLIAQAVSGFMSLTGDPEGPPYRAGVAIFDVITGLHGLVGVLSALHQRSRTGVGQHVEVNLLSSALSGLVNQSGAFAAGGTTAHRLGNAHPSIYPYEVFPAHDRDVVIAAANDRQFRSLCGVLVLPDVADDDRFATNAARVMNRSALHPILLGRLARWKADDLFSALVGVGVPCGPINSVAEGLAFAEQLGLAPFVAVTNGERSVRAVRNPITFSAAAARYDTPPPELGANSETIRDWLSN